MLIQSANPEPHQRAVKSELLKVGQMLILLISTSCDSYVHLSLSITTAGLGMRQQGHSNDSDVLH